MKLKIIFFVFIFINSISSVQAEKLNIYYSGFSFTNNYESNEANVKYSSLLTKEIDPKTNLNIISSALKKNLEKNNFININLVFDELINLEKNLDNAIVMSVALQNEQFAQEYNYATKKYNGFYDSYFQIIFYDFSSKNLIASIPFDFEISMLSEKEFTQEEILKRIKSFYINDNPFSDLVEKINNFEIKKKYDLRIGVTKVQIQDRAFDEMPENAKKFEDAYKNLFAEIFSKWLSKTHNVAIVPYTEGQVIGNTMKLRFVQTDKIYSINLPSPDFHVHINLQGFKKVLAQTSAIEELYLYGSFINLKIFQPDLSKVYFENNLRGVTKIKIPKDQSEVNDWRKYNYNMEILFDKFSKNIIKPDSKWIKETTEKNIKKELQDLKKIIETLK